MASWDTSNAWSRNYYLLKKKTTIYDSVYHVPLRLSVVVCWPSLQRGSFSCGAYQLPDPLPPAEGGLLPGRHPAGAPHQLSTQHVITVYAISWSETGAPLPITQ